MVQPFLNKKDLCSARGATRDLTAAFNRYKSGQLDSDESENQAILDQKSRYVTVLQPLCVKFLIFRCFLKVFGTKHRICQRQVPRSVHSS